MMKRMLSAVMCLAMVLSLVTVLTPLKAQAAEHGTFDTSLDYYLWLKEDDSGNYNYRWNADGTVKGNVIHLDIPSGGNCAFHFTDAGDGYYGIMCTKGSRYVDTDGNDNKEKRVLHQWSDDLDQDNQKFKFIPVDGEEDTYLIQVKNSGLYVGLNDYDEPEQHQKLVTADKDHAWEWVVVPTVPPLENNTLLPGEGDHQHHRRTDYETDARGARDCFTAG